LGRITLVLPDDLDARYRAWVKSEYGEGRGALKVAGRRMIKEYLESKGV